ncbi:MAG: TIM barrel protein, partial [Oscillospiraceae bacterium]
LGAKILVYHGDFMQNKFEFKKSCENYHKLYKIGLEYGVSLCQENVVRCKCGLAENIILMRDYLNDEVEFVFDLKQSLRSGEPNEKMLNAMRGKLRHIHISDFCEENDCILPGKGNADFIKLAKLLQEQNYQGDIILELYKNGYDKPKELVDAIKWLETLGKPFA